jgi:hypothetical protein
MFVYIIYDFRNALDSVAAFLILIAWKLVVKVLGHKYSEKLGRTFFSFSPRMALLLKSCVFNIRIRF